MTEEGRQKAFETIQKEEIDALVVIGGNGSLTGAMNFAREFDVCCIGLPGTIDNDPVSYTHLDVDKRQVVYGWWLEDR